MKKSVDAICEKTDVRNPIEQVVKEELKLQAKFKERKRDHKAKRKVRTFGKVFNGLWSDEEQIRFIAATKVFGRDWTRVSEHVASRDYSAVQQFSATLKYTFQDDSTLPGADILPILEDVRPGWTNEETTRLVEGIRKYGK